MKTTTRNFLVGAFVAAMAIPASAERFAPARSTAPSATRSSSTGTSTTARPIQPARPQRVAAPHSAPQAFMRPSSQSAQMVSAQRNSMEFSIRRGATPPFNLIPKDGVRMVQTRGAHYKNQITAAFDISGVPGGNLSLTALLPVSGHVGWPQAQSYANSNQYNLVVTHADGTKQTLPKTAANGLVTAAELNLQLKPGKTVIQMWPDGSGGVGGYKAGREIEVNWDGR